MDCSNDELSAEVPWFCLSSINDSGQLTSLIRSKCLLRSMSHFVCPSVMLCLTPWAGPLPAKDDFVVGVVGDHSPVVLLMVSAEVVGSWVVIVECSSMVANRLAHAVKLARCNVGNCPGPTLVADIEH